MNLPNPAFCGWAWQFLDQQTHLQGRDDRFMWGPSKRNELQFTTNIHSLNFLVANGRSIHNLFILIQSLKGIWPFSNAPNCFISVRQNFGVNNHLMAYLMLSIHSYCNCIYFSAPGPSQSHVAVAPKKASFLHMIYNVQSNPVIPRNTPTAAISCSAVVQQTLLSSLLKVLRARKSQTSPSCPYSSSLNMVILNDTWNLIQILRQNVYTSKNLPSFSINRLHSFAMSTADLPVHNQFTQLEPCNEIIIPLLGSATLPPNMCATPEPTVVLVIVPNIRTRGIRTRGGIPSHKLNISEHNLPKIGHSKRKVHLPASECIQDG